jgi:hypothetical protein
LIRRALKGENLWHAHREHFYQQAVQRGLSHAKVTSMVAFLGALLLKLAWLAEHGWSLIALSTALILTVSFLFLLKGRQS